MSELSKLKMSSSAVKLFIFMIISCLQIYARTNSGVSSPVTPRRTELGTQVVTVLPLDMAEQSVDDQFNNCKAQNESQIVENYLNIELSDQQFNRVWKKYKNNSTDNVDTSIKAYTDPSTLQKKLNNKTLNGRTSYTSGFPYKAFHYLLTHGVQRYKVKQCTLVYRRTRDSFDRNIKGHEIRFGRFTSTSLRSDLIRFGNKSCFVINTCHGGDITDVSVYVEKEDEVLIPPYEKFKVTDVTPYQAKPNEMKCEVIYKLTSTGTFSNMNCEMFKGKSLSDELYEFLNFLCSFLTNVFLLN